LDSLKGIAQRSGETYAVAENPSAAQKQVCRHTLQNSGVENPQFCKIRVQVGDTLETIILGLLSMGYATPKSELPDSSDVD
jgi:hypothetical protein